MKDGRGSHKLSHVIADMSAAKSYTLIALAVVTILSLAILATWLVLLPQKPTFALQDATLYAFKLTNSNLFLTTTFQVTLSSRNPNRRVGVDYTRLGVYATYRNQQITNSTVLPQSYLGTKDMTVWSPFLSGVDVAISPNWVEGVRLDVEAGDVIVDVKVYGRLRWKVGSWLSGTYHLAVNCPVYLKMAGRAAEEGGNGAGAGAGGGGGGDWVAVIGGVRGGVRYDELDQGCNVVVST
ncbi:unnamed protein product [Linum tenue]|uniref:Late embryogenesis abundant protein LEA-2 subgroup domain-containing protein n=1 Tax=Linum tenue TaxID=586396 RepID=A0AAV0QFQ6_9ROSI|nr:unnamed protein product [Linum tenue]